jgi:chromosome segregation ATPase
MHLFNEINECEIKTLEMVQRTADCARQQVTELMNSNNAIVEAELDHISKELRRRKEDNDYLEQDIERLSKNLEQIQVNIMTYSPDIKLNITPID